MLTLSYPARLIEKLAAWLIGRLSPAEKAAVLTRVSESFFSGLTPEEKGRLIEQMLPHLLAGIDLKEFLPRLLITLWKGAETGEAKENPGILEKMRERLPSMLKNRL